MDAYAISEMFKQGKIEQKLHLPSLILVKDVDGKKIWMQEHLEFINKDTNKSMGRFTFDHWDEINEFLLDHMFPHRHKKDSPEGKKSLLKKRMNAIFGKN